MTFITWLPVTTPPLNTFPVLLFFSEEQFYDIAIYDTEAETWVSLSTYRKYHPNQRPTHWTHLPDPPTTEGQFIRTGHLLN